MSAACSHQIDIVRCARDLYLNLSFTKLWSMQLGARTFSREAGLCLHCYSLYSSVSAAKAHAEQTNHNLFFTIRPFGILCWNCLRRFQSPKAMTEAACLSLQTFPSESLPVGFYNLGNSCYSNAVLIALSHCQPLVTAAAVSALPICRLFAAAATLNRSFNTVVPELLSKFSPYVQEDAAEFLLYIVDLLTNDYRVKELFSGKTTRHQFCLSCSHHSECTQGFTVLPVNLDDKGWGDMPKVSSHMARSYGRPGVFVEQETTSFGTSFVSFLQHGSTHRVSLGKSLESMCRASSIVCENCKVEDAVVFTSFSELPEILILQIARFGKRWFGLGKVHKMVLFPDLNVDFSHLVEEEIDCGPSKYNLTAIVFHTGFMNDGHYQCYAKKHDKWYLFDDASVSLVTREEVLKCQGYLLFYTKIPTQEVSNLRFELARNCGKEALGFALPVNILSNPKQWIGKVPHGSRDELLAPASELAGGDVLRDVVDDDKKAKFVTELPFATKIASISNSAADMIWAFLTEKGALPIVTNLAQEGGIQVVDTVSQFYVDPATLPEPSQSPAEEESADETPEAEQLSADEAAADRKDAEEEHDDHDQPPGEMDQ